MRLLRLVPAVFLLAASLILLESGTGHAAFHCMRIHAVMGGYLGDDTIQYVELRMVTGGQTVVGGHTLHFYDGSDTLKATFTFPANVSAGDNGSSIVVATAEFDSNTLGGNADFVFSGANTVGSNGGDALHPVQAPDGRVVFAQSSAGCAFQVPVDSVAYGTATADYGSAAVALPSPSDGRALRLNNLALSPSDNSTEYSLETVSGTTFTVAIGSLKSDASTPRNNDRVVLDIVEPVGGVAEAPGVESNPVAANEASGGRGGAVIIALVASAFVISIAGGAWYARRRIQARASWWDEQT